MNTLEISYKLENWSGNKDTFIAGNRTYSCIRHLREFKPIENGEKGVSNAKRRMDLGNCGEQGAAVRY